MGRHRSTDRPARYQIKLSGRLDEKWSGWFEEMAVAVGNESDDQVVTTLTGLIADQSALRGILSKIWNLNLTVLSIVRVEGKPEGKT